MRTSSILVRIQRSSACRKRLCSDTCSSSNLFHHLSCRRKTSDYNGKDKLLNGAKIKIVNKLINKQNDTVEEIYAETLLN